MTVLPRVVRLLQEATQNDQRTRRLEVCGLNTKDLAALDKAVAEGRHILCMLPKHYTRLLMSVDPTHGDASGRF
jgi:hypothetical protein